MQFSKLIKGMALEQIHWMSLKPFLSKELGWSTELTKLVYILPLSHTNIPMGFLWVTQTSDSHGSGVSSYPREQSADN